MTNTIYPPSKARLPENRIDLKRWLCQFTDLSTAAFAAMVNLELAAVSPFRRRHLFLLDFDVICESFLSVEEILKNTDAQAEPDRPWDFMGPATLRHCLKHIAKTGSALCLPPGTVAELESYLLKKSKGIRKSASSIRSMINVDSGRPSDMFRSLAGEKKKTQLRATISELCTSISNVHLVEDLQASGIAYSDMINPSANESVRMLCDATFEATMDRLRSERPNKGINNFHDSVNVSFLSWVTSARQRDHDEFLPILVSKSRHVTGNRTQAVFNRHSGLTVDDRRSSFKHEIINSHHYLMIFDYFINAGSANLKQAAHDARMFCENVEAFRRLLKDMVTQLDANQLDIDSDREVPRVKLVRLAWQKLLGRHHAFFSPMHTSGAEDRVALLDALAQKIARDGRQMTVDAVEGLMRECGKDTFLDLEYLVHKYAYEAASDRIQLPNAETKVSRIYDIQVCDAITPFIKTGNVASRGSIFEAKEEDLILLDEMRMLVTGRFFKSRRPFLAIDSWNSKEDMGRRSMAIRVTHQCSFIEVMAIVRLFSLFDGPNNEMFFFLTSREGHVSSHCSANVEELVGVCYQIFGRTGKPGFLRFDSSLFTCEIDVGDEQPEMQLRFVANSNCFNPITVKRIAEILARRNVTNVAMESLEELLSYAVSRIKEYETT